MSFQTYNTSVPNPPDLPSVDVGAMQTNTLSISNLISVDHFGFMNNSGGWHKHVTLPFTNGVVPTTSAAIGALYVDTDSGGQQALWFVRDNIGATNVQLTTSKIVAPVTATAGYTFLPGGLLLQWDTVSTLPGPNGPFTFPHAFTGTPYSLVLTPISNSTGGSYAYLPMGATTFNITRTGTGVAISVNYIVVGLA